MTNPYLISTPFSDAGDKQEILESAPIDPNDPTWTAGFPTITSTPIAEGGLPPKRISFNGVLNAITQNIVHQSKGLMYEFDADYAVKIGGYPLGSKLVLNNGEVVVSLVPNNSNNPNLNMTGWVKDKQIKSLKDYGAVSGQDSTQAFKDAIAAEDVLYLGGYGDNFLISEEIQLRSGCTYISDGVKFTGVLGIEGTAPYTPKGIIASRAQDNITINGTIETYIDHLDFAALGDATNKPTITGLLAWNNTNSDFGKWDSVGSVNYFYSPNFKEHGIIDTRDNTDCYFEVINANGRYGEESPASTPSTIGVWGTGNVRCYLKASVKNCYWSGILWEGIDCVLDNPFVRNTKGSNLNLAGLRVICTNPNLRDSEQGNLSIGEGATQAEAIEVTGGYIGECNYANIHLHTVTKNCKITGQFLYGWGQIGSASDSTAAVRCRGDGNEVDVTYAATHDGLTSIGDGIITISSSLTTPESKNHVISAVGHGAKVRSTSPYITFRKIHVSDYAGGAAIDMGFRCAGSVVENLTAARCNRPLAYNPNTADSADYANVKFGQINDVECTNRSVFYGKKIVYEQRAEVNVYASETAFVLDQILHAVNVYSNDSSITGAGKLASAIRHVCADASGTSYGINLIASTISGGSLVNTAHKFRWKSFEIEGASGSVIAASPDGTRYKLTPPNGGGAATWVVAT